MPYVFSRCSFGETGNLFPEKRSAEINFYGGEEPAPQGKAPIAPSLLAMGTILQGYHGVSDAEAVELTVVDLRWQMGVGSTGLHRAGVFPGQPFQFQRAIQL